MSRVPIQALAVLLVVCTSSPPAAAFVWQPDPLGPDDPLHLGPQCIILNVTLATEDGTFHQRHASNDLPEIGKTCNYHEVTFEWNVSASQTHGTLTFRLGPSNVSAHSLGDQPLPRSPLSGLLGLLDPSSPPPTSTPIPVAPAPSSSGIVVTVGFDAAWGGDCRDAHGTFSASLNDAGVSQEAPQGFFHRLCALSTASAPGLALGAVSVASDLAQALVPPVGLPVFTALAQGLLALASLPAVPTAPPAPAVPTPQAPGTNVSTQGADDEERAAGNATVAALQTPSLASGAYNATVSTPEAQARAAGGVAVPAPSPPLRGRTPLAVPSGVAPRTLLSPTRQEPAPPLARPPAPTLSAGAPQGASPAPAGSPGARALSLAAPAAAPSLAVRALAAGALLLLAAFALHQRISRATALKHEGRLALLRAAQQAPRAATAGELAAAVGMERKTAEYHLRQLARMGLLRTQRDPDGPWRYASRGLDRAEAAPPLDESVLARIRERPGASASDLARDLGVTRRRVDRRVKDLLLQGLVESRVEGGRRRLYPS